MKIAVLSDIHSNAPALRAVLEEMRATPPDRLFVLGDIFGYYPWALETWDLVRSLPLDTVYLKGNHDQLLLDAGPPDPEPSYWRAARHNEAMLRDAAPAALDWLASLASSARVTVDSRRFTLCHGTPADPLLGRFYPDDDQVYDWFPSPDEWLLLGHTHYPLEKRPAAGGIIMNPGAVGQPRDGNPEPSWGIIDTERNTMTFMRTRYDWRACARDLEDRGWDRRAILALQKNYRGELRGAGPGDYKTPRAR